MIIIEKTILPAANSTFAIGAISCSADTFVVKESSVLLTGICAKNPPLATSQTVMGNFRTTQRQAK